MDAATASAGQDMPQPRAAGSAPEGALLGAAAALFAASAAATIAWSMSMAAMGAMPMPGGWTLSMAWMPMDGQSWPGLAAAFLGMWAVMMPAMMTPALTPMLRRYRRAVAATAAHAGCLSTTVAAAYFLVWTAFGLPVFALGAALAAAAMQWPALARAAPFAAGLLVLGAGVLQFTAWKARQLACCRETPLPGRIMPPTTATAWRHGLRLGMHCVRCCLGPTAVLLALGFMDLRVMAVVTAAITTERLAPAGLPVARAVGALAITAGLFQAARAVGLR